MGSGRETARRWAIGTLLGLALAGAGCGGDDDAPPAEEPAGTATEGAGTSRPPEATTTATPTAAAPETPAEPLASREGAIDGQPVRLEIIELSRSGDTVALSFRLTLGEGADATGRAQVAGTFSDGVFEETTDAGGRGFNPALTANLDGISLIDAENRKRHLVARDSNGVCVCDTDLQRVFVRRDAPEILSARFAAPPAEVEAMDVQITSFGAFADVPLS